VNDVLDVGRLESGSMVLERQSVDFAAVTRHVAAEFAGIASERQQRVSLALPRVALTTGDRQMLRQVIVNLFSNALKYTPSGGRIDVSLTTGENLLMWQVRDTGIGIPMAAQSRLFEKFFRADNAALLETDGTGLGLHLAQLIVGRSGRRIWCESEEGVGATFIFTLPAEQAVHA
jgi:signal transduction histidine kinase